ncbi:unnamed protein product [Closterium sp. NIES-54]
MDTLPIRVPTSDSVRSSPPRYRIACAFAPKKVRSFLTPSLIAACFSKGIEIVPVDPSRSLLEYRSSSEENELATDVPQKPPFDAVVHKVLTAEWADQLRILAEQFPTFAGRIVDPTERIARVCNRASMLQGLLPDADTCQATEISKLAGEEKAAVGVEVTGGWRNGEGEEEGRKWEIVPGFFVCVPQQMVLTLSELRRLAGDPQEGPSGSSYLQDVLQSQGLSCPLVAKPVEANGSTASHSLSLVFNTDGLMALAHSLEAVPTTTSPASAVDAADVAPDADTMGACIPAVASVSAQKHADCKEPSIVLQQFINHGSRLTKLYVVGSSARCEVRPSLPDVAPSQCQPDVSPGYLPFSHVSNVPVPQPTHLPNAGSSTDSSMNMGTDDLWPGPLPDGVADALGKHLREQLGLRLFNVDIVRSVACPNRFFIIDVNYFPGFAKLHGYEELLSDFFLSLLQNK